MRTFCIVIVWKRRLLKNGNLYIILHRKSTWNVTFRQAQHTAWA